VSLSELSRLPVSNLRLSAHISAAWTRQKGNKAPPERDAVDRLGPDIVSRPRCALTGAWQRVRSARAACRGPRAARLQTVKTARLFLQQKAQLLEPLQNQLALTFTSPFCHLPQTRRARSAALCTTPSEAQIHLSLGAGKHFNVFQQELWWARLFYRKKYQFPKSHL